VTQLTVIRGDLTRQDVDAVVNAANSSLMGGGGVDGAIHAAGGPAILAECRQIVRERGPLPTGEAVITTAGEMAPRYVVHTVGPVYARRHAAEATDLLAACYRSSLDVAADAGCRTIAFPNISTGVYGYPKAEAASVAVGAVRRWLEDRPGDLDEIRFVCFDAENEALYRALLED
jgi:O-acetyl-ADP-ribose deacetylase (regulator of RNase III)